MKKPSKAKLYKEWRDAVLKAWDYKCAVCGRGAPEVILDCHHLISKSLKGIRYDVKASCPLCKSHHKFDSKLSAHKGTVLFMEWLRYRHPEILRYLIFKLGDTVYVSTQPK